MAGSRTTARRTTARRTTARRTTARRTTARRTTARRTTARQDNCPSGQLPVRITACPTIFAGDGTQKHRYARLLFKKIIDCLMLLEINS